MVAFRVLPAVIPLAVVEIDQPEPLDLETERPDLIGPAIDDVLKRGGELCMCWILLGHAAQLFRKRLRAKHRVGGQLVAREAAARAPRRERKSDGS